MSEFSLRRQQAGLSIHDAARQLGYDERTLYRWERGESQPRPAVFEALRAIAATASPSDAPPLFTFIDLFAGIGGLRKGFEKIRGRCVFTCELDRFSQQTYRANFPSDEHEIVSDINSIQEARDPDAPETDIPNFDVLLAGFPCQPFSIAGVSKKNALNRPHGFACATQGTLFFNLANIIARHRPKAFVLENVKNILSHEKGSTFRTIRNILENDLDYSFSFKVLDAKHWVPQHRERVFMVGFRRDTGFSFDNFAIPGTKRTLREILHPEDGSEAPEPPYTTGNIAKVDGKYVLSEHLWGYLQNYAEEHQKKGNGFGFGLVGPDDIARTLSQRYYKDGSEILIRRDSGSPRRLTPRECARLMGFDTPEQKFIIKVSDTQAYRQFGNSVAVPVVEAVAEHMKPFIEMMVLQPDDPLEQRQVA